MNRREAMSLLALPVAAPVITSRTVFARFNPNSVSFAGTQGFLKKFLDDGQANGAIAWIYRQGKLQLDLAVGWMDAEHKTPMRRDAIFSMASMSKPMTGVAAMILLEQGKIKLEDHIERWIPELANRKVLRKPDGPLDDTYPSPRPITVADVLSYHMGLGGDGPTGPVGEALRKIPTRAETDPDTWIKQLSEIPLQYAPGERWLYDTPVDVLSVLIRRVTGGTLTAFEQRHIFGPLGMKDTGFFVPPEKIDRVAGWPEGNRTTTTEPAKFESGAHGMYSAAEDYLRFARMLLNKGELDGKRILKPESVAAMATDRLRPEEHKNGGFYDRYPGRGFGFTVAVRTDPLPVGPAIGSFNWAGATGVWFIIDPKNAMVVLLMVQHPSRGQNAKTGIKYLTQIGENDMFQDAVYRDLSGA